MPSWAYAANVHHPSRPPAVLPLPLGEVPNFAQAFSAAALPACPTPNPNLLGPPNFRDGCPLPAAGLNLTAPLNSPNFTGTVTVNGQPIGSGGGGSTPGGPNGSIQYNKGGALGGYIIGPSLGLVNSGTTLDLAVGAACFNLGAWSGDLVGAACSPPTLVSGAAARNLGSAGGAVTGPWSNLSLVPSSVFSAMGTPGGDLGGTSYTNPLVTGLNGFPLCAGVQPSTQTTLVWTGACYMPTAFAPGINLTTGDVVCGPGSGTQPCKIQPSVVTNSLLAPESSATLKGNPTGAAAQPTDLPIAGSLAFSGGALGLAPSGVVGQQVSVSAPSAATLCWSIDAFGRTTNIASGSCSGGVILTADDNLTQLTADDGVTILTAESSGGGVGGCTTNFVAKFNVNCNAIMAAVR
jgi:hypothetical protein